MLYGDTTTLGTLSEKSLKTSGAWQQETHRQKSEPILRYRRWMGTSRLNSLPMSASREHSFTDALGTCIGYIYAWLKSLCLYVFLVASFWRGPVYTVGATRDVSSRYQNSGCSIFPLSVKLLEYVYGRGDSKEMKKNDQLSQKFES